jgi:NO-binding membrane sensor protein with MHYT domain
VGGLSTRRSTSFAAAAISLAVAIWTMHFVGMLAVRLPFSIDYLVFPTLLSFLVCVLVVGAAVYATSAGPLTLLRLAFVGLLDGRQHLHDALHRDERTPHERSHNPCPGLCRG